MVGRELPNLRPHGQDHPGVDRGEMLRLKTTSGFQVVGLLKNWTARIRMHKTIGWQLQEVVDGMRVMSFGLRV